MVWCSHTFSHREAPTNKPSLSNTFVLFIHSQYNTVFILPLQLGSKNTLCQCTCIIFLSALEHWRLNEKITVSPTSQSSRLNQTLVLCVGGAKATQEPSSLLTLSTHNAIYSSMSHLMSALPCSSMTLRRGRERGLLGLRSVCSVLWILYSPRLEWRPRDRLASGQFYSFAQRTPHSPWRPCNM